MPSVQPLRRRCSHASAHQVYYRDKTYSVRYTWISRGFYKPRSALLEVLGHQRASVAMSHASRSPAQPLVPEDSHGPQGVWYFAYGSNMNPNTLTGRRQVVPSESCPASLRGWTLSFRMLGLPYAEPGFATIERVGNEGCRVGNDQQQQPAGRAGLTAAAAPPAAPSRSASTSPTTHTSAATAAAVYRWRSEVHGVLHRVTQAEWTNIMATEGVGGGPYGYRVVEVEVLRYDGHRVRALTLEGQQPSLHAASRPVAPSRRYLQIIREGARHHGLHPDYLAFLDSLSPYEGVGWGPAAGRAAAAAVALPLALPLLPGILLLRMARKQTTDRQTSRAEGMPPAAATSPSATAQAITTPAAAAPVKVTPASRAQTSSSLSEESAALRKAHGQAVEAAAADVSASVRSGNAVGVVASAETVVPPLRMGPLPPELVRPAVTLPAVASAYLSAVQQFAWALHDVVAVPLLGSGSSSGGGGGGSSVAGGS